MIKKYKKTLIASSLALLIPVIVGLLLWDKLPDPMPSHWNIHGEVDAWSSKAFLQAWPIPNTRTIIPR